MASALPILLIGGAAILLGGKKKRRSSSKKALPPETTEDAGADLPSMEDEDLDREPPPSPGPSTEPSTGPSTGPSSTPSTPSTPALPEPSEPYGKPAMGPAGSSTCVASLYSRDARYIDNNIQLAQGAFNLFKEEGYYFYINYESQKKLYDYMLNRFQSMESGGEVRTVASVVLREALKHFNSSCQWDFPIDSLSEPEKLVWEGGSRLVMLAQFTAGMQDPGPDELFQTGQRFTITRNSLGQVDPGFMGVDNETKMNLPGTRVELLVTDQTQENAEHIIGKIMKMSGPNGEPNLFEVDIVGTFQGSDVAPRLRLKHGFKVGSNAYFSQVGPTGIFKMFPKGME